MNKKVKFLINCILLLIFITSISVLFIGLFYPAYRSFQLACRPNEINVSESSISYVKVGGDGDVPYKSPTDVNTSLVEVKIADGSPKSVIKHENCHLNQYISRKLFYNCDKPLRHYLLEVECHTTEILPDFIYYKLYKKYI